MMTGTERRKKLLDVLTGGSKPIPGYKLAAEYGVSRQVIVQDIAILRAEKHDIMATSRGYKLYSNHSNFIKRLVRVRHEFEDLEKELRTVVDYGGRILDTVIDHDVYGEIKVDLMIETEEDIKGFLEKMTESENIPMLCSLTQGEHYHTIEAKNDKILDVIETELSKIGSSSSNE